MVNVSLAGPSNVAERVADVLEGVLPTLTRAMRVDVEAVRDALREPIRVAVTGRVNSGKSTLVNALIRQRVAPTDVSECTRLVTWFRYGYPQRLEVVLRDGTRREQQLASGGRLPSSLGVEPSLVDHLEVWLSNEVLRSMTLIDTPGLASLNAEYSHSTEELLGIDRLSRDATEGADAMVFLLNQEVKSDELAALRTFRDAGGGSAANAVGVLNKVDKLSHGTDWYDVGQALAKRLELDLSEDVAAVIPLAGLLAETSETAALTEADADHLNALAHLPADVLNSLLLSVSSFIDEEVTIESSVRSELLALLDLQGVAAAIELIGSGVTGASALRRELVRRSGVNQLRETLLEGFRDHGEALKVRSALQHIELLCYRPADDPDHRPMRALRDHIEQLRLDPSMHTVAAIDAFHTACTFDHPLPDQLFDDLRAFATEVRLADQLRAESDTVDALRLAAVAGAARWRQYLVGASLPLLVRQLGRVALRSFSLAYRAASESSSTPHSGRRDMDDPDG